MKTIPTKIKEFLDSIKKLEISVSPGVKIGVSVILLLAVLQHCNNQQEVETGQIEENKSVIEFIVGENPFISTR